mmetsp:Transcript_81033/g.160581  ORF Transcript_81033/g.160581 Transcript_81033/m.160581 type:complete len:208 (-) Transcript_81033:1589-2212(-)
MSAAPSISTPRLPPSLMTFLSKSWRAFRSSSGVGSAGTVDALSPFFGLGAASFFGADLGAASSFCFFSFLGAASFFGAATSAFESLPCTGASPRESAVVVIDSSASCLSVISDGDSIMVSRPWLFFGNAMKFLMVVWPPRIVQSLSRPKASPPCGGAPYSKALMRKPNWSCASCFVKPRTSKTFSCSARLCILMEPPPTSTPLMTMS